MSDDDTSLKIASAEKPKLAEGQVTLAQMLKVLDKDVATGVEKRLKKLSKKKGFKPVVNELEVAQLNRKAAYEEAVQEVSKWEPIVKHNRHANLSFPLDTEIDNLPSTAESLINIKPRNDLEREVQLIIDENRAALAKEREQRKAEERYQKAISAEEAKERHLELQKTRVRLNEFAAKMRRQNKIKSKSYHRLLKQERIKKHLKRVETNKDALMDEIERLQKIRAQERATLRHKNTGKWAKHAKFRAKYDEEARRLMLEQIGLAKKRLEKPVTSEQDVDDDDSDESDDIADSVDSIDDGVDDDDDVDDGDDDEEEDDEEDTGVDHVGNDFDEEGGSNDGDDDDDKAKDGRDIDEKAHRVVIDEDEQRRLLSEAFADDDVVGDFQRAKEQTVQEEQPKDVDTYLPGWGGWTGPGVASNEHKRQKFVKKAKKIIRMDEALNHVIISERANDSIRALQPKDLPRGHTTKVLSKPVTASFANQSSFRDSIRPRITTKLGARIEPINKRVLTSGGKATWT